MPKIGFAELPPRPDSLLGQLSVAVRITAISISVAMYSFEQTRKRQTERPRTWFPTRP
ncbi:hypothetical protein AB6809_24990 [Paraburkholderia sp. RCC_158]